MVLLNNYIFSQEIATRAQIYDFDIGDIFHYTEIESYGAGQEEYGKWINDTIIDKYYSENYDTVFYLVKRDLKELDYLNVIWTYDSYTYTRTIANLSSMVNNGNIDTVFSNPNFYNGRLINMQKYTIYDIGGNLPDSTVYIKKWVVGCGLVWDSWEDFPFWCLEEFQLEYYKKGNEEWGTPVIVVNTRESKTKEPYIFPIPAKNELHIDLFSNPDLLEFINIYSANGELVKTIKVLNPYQIKINIQDLKKGYYILNLNSKDNSFNSKFLKH